MTASLSTISYPDLTWFNNNKSVNWVQDSVPVYCYIDRGQTREICKKKQKKAKYLKAKIVVFTDNLSVSCWVTDSCNFTFYKGFLSI